jgi:hypothetical protein
MPEDSTISSRRSARRYETMNHVVLLGDSIFDNAHYVPGGPAVIEQLRQALPTGWRATLLAVDGSIATRVEEQLTGLPADASHLVVSAGGNDALGYGIAILNESARSVSEALSRLGEIRQEFEAEYRTMLQAVLQHDKPTIVCTVYDAIPVLGAAERAGLCVFNDVILCAAFRAGVPVIDLRLICNEPTDYSESSPIEPSVAGGAKIARAVARAVAGFDDTSEGIRVYT